ncbi:MAG: stalk domain-containing protein [Caldisericaceae bacterium]
MAAWLAGYVKVTGEPDVEVAHQHRPLVPREDETQISHKFFHVVPNYSSDPDACDVYISNYPGDDLGLTGDNELSPTVGTGISDYARKLPEEIDYIKSKGNVSIDIVAHSMGGLVARRYIESRDFSHLLQDDHDHSDDYYHGDVNELIMLGTPNHGLFIALVGTYVFASLLVSQLGWWRLGGFGLFWGPFLNQFRLLKPVDNMAIKSHFLNTLNSGISGRDVDVDYYTIAGRVPVYLDSTDKVVSSFPWDVLVLSNEVKLREAKGNIDVYYTDHIGLMKTKEISDLVKSLIHDNSFSGSGGVSAPYNPSMTFGHRFVLERAFGWPGLWVLTIHCPINTTVKDQYGRVIDSQGHNEIPNAEVQVIDDEKNFCLPGNLSYTIELNAYSAGTFTMESAYLGKDNGVVASVFKDVNIDTNTKLVSSTIEPGSVDFTLEVDYDGNGTVDYYITPDVEGSTDSEPLPPINLKAELNHSSVILEWTSTIPNTFSISGYEIYRGTLEGEGWPSLIATVSAGTTMYTDTSVTIGEKYYYYVEAFDNQSPPNYSWASNEVIVDTSKFTYTITASTGFGGSITPSGSVTVNYGDSKTFTIKADPKFMIARVLVDGSPIRITNPITMTYTFSNVISNHTISAEFVLIPDTTPPTLILPTISGVDLNLPNATITTNQSTFTFTVSATDDSGVISRMVVKVNGVVQIDKNNLDPTIYLSEGANTVEVTVYDPSGNYTTKSFKVTVDTKPPVIDVTLPETVSSQELTVKGTAFDQVTGIQSLTVNGNPVIPTLEGNFETKLTLSSGANTITIEAVDKVGNKSTKSFTVSYVQPQPRQSYMVVLKIGDPTITVNGTSKKIDAQGSKPIIKNGRTLLPIRILIESLGGTVEWNAKEQKVTITLNGHSMILWIGKTTALVDGSKAPLDVAPQIINGRTYIPLRFVSEHLGASVNWDDKTQTITIYYWP